MFTFFFFGGGGFEITCLFLFHFSITKLFNNFIVKYNTIS